jgi:LuxR family transcriptional regulator, maltose regulon positive regulatory protein
MFEERFTFLRTKLNRPRVMLGCIHRPRLLEQLNLVLDKPVALVCAPAGFGKTILLSQWVEQCPLPSAWLQLEENDSELPMFFAGVVEALRQIFPECLLKTANLLHSNRPVPQDAWKTALISDLDSLDGNPFVLALDDYHLLNNPSIDLLLSDVLRRELQAPHLIISTRRSPAMSFGRLKVQGQMIEVRTTDLRFNQAEAALYLTQAIGSTLSQAAIEQLNEKMEGWVAGLALAAMDLREDVDPEDLIRRLDGSDRRVSDYLLDQVFNSQPAEIQSFLLKTATLDQFCAPLCQAVFDAPQGQAYIKALLEQVENSQLFLTPLDNQRYWYRYHHLFRQMLLTRQHLHFRPEEIEQFHRRAAAWLAEKGMFDEALDHLIAIQDWIGAAQLVESQLCHLLNSENSQGIKRRLAYFPEEFIATRPGLLLMQAWIAHFGLRLPLLLSLTGKIEHLVDAALLQYDEPGSVVAPPGFEVIPPLVVQAQIRVMQSAQYSLTNQGDEAIAAARQAIENLPESWLFVRGNAMLYLGLSLFMEGQVNEAITLLMQDYETLQEQYNPYGVRLLFCIATIYLLQGDLERCRLIADQVLREAQAANLLLLQGWGNYLLGRVHMEWNELEQAAKYYSAVADGRYTSNLICALEGIAGYVYVETALGQCDEVHQSLDMLLKFHSEQAGPPHQSVLSLIAWLNLLDDDLEKARRWADSFSDLAIKQSMVWYHIPHLYKGHILVELGETDNVQAADILLNELQVIAERTHNTFTSVRVLSLRAVMLVQQGRRSEALETLERAVRLAHPGHFIRTFLDLGLHMNELLQQLYSQMKSESGISEYIRSILSAFPAPAGAIPSLPSSRPEIKALLTERELDVLKLLTERLSIKEISARLCISTSTVQQHTHHIYRKLGVCNKRQAVFIAQELGLIHS